MAGLYASSILIERSLATVVAGDLTPVFVAPCDLDVVGLLAHVTTAPGAGDEVTVNILNTPTSQSANVAAYDLWTTANVPTISGVALSSVGTTTSVAVIDNRPYALDYPLPGPAGTSGFETAQSTSYITQTPVTAPPQEYRYELDPYVAPDNTYTDFNGVVGTPASVVHAGDVLTFVVGGTVGAAADLEVVLFVNKR